MKNSFHQSDKYITRKIRSVSLPDPIEQVWPQFSINATGSPSFSKYIQFLIEQDMKSQLTKEVSATAEIKSSTKLIFNQLREVAHLLDIVMFSKGVDVELEDLKESHNALMELIKTKMKNWYDSKNTSNQITL